MRRPKIGDTVTLMVTWTTREEALRTLATLCRAWPRIAPHMDRGEGKRRRPLLDDIRRDILAWSGVRDCARVETRHCSDIKDIATAARKAMPRAARTHEALGHFADALSSGYWNARDEDTETYEWDGSGWCLTRERGKPVEVNP